MVKNLPALWETWVRPLGWENTLKKGKAIHSSTLAWRISWTVEPGGLHFTGLQKVRGNWATTLRNHNSGNLRTKLLQDSSRFKPRLILFIHTQKVNPRVCLRAALCLSQVFQLQTETVYFLENCFDESQVTIMGSNSSQDPLWERWERDIARHWLRESDNEHREGRGGGTWRTARLSTQMSSITRLHRVLVYLG